MEEHLTNRQTETVRALEACNQKTAAFGLTLTGEEMEALAEGRERALADTGRVEFGDGILPALIDALCDSLYLQQSDWAETLLSAQAVFYHWKEEAGDLVPDRALLAFLRRAFDGARGAISYLEGFSLKELRERKEETQWDAED